MSKRTFYVALPALNPRMTTAQGGPGSDLQTQDPCRSQLGGPTSGLGFLQSQRQLAAV